MTESAMPPIDPAGKGITAGDLEEMILQFNDTTARMMESHQRLQERVSELTRELDEKNQALLRKRRLEELGEMAAGVAHEIRNPLGGIQLYASLLEKDLPDRPDSLRLVRQITQGVTHLNTIVEDMLAFTRDLSPTLAPVHLHVVLEEALAYAVGADDAAGVTLARRYDESLPPVLCDRHLLQRALLNVLLNAMQAVNKRGTISLITGRDGDDAVVSVADSGPGIPADILDKIFNPFFTRKDKGTGLGLAIVHRVMEGHKGSVSAGNAPGGGAVFTLRLPLDRKDA